MSNIPNSNLKHTLTNTNNSRPLSTVKDDINEGHHYQTNLRDTGSLIHRSEVIELVCKTFESFIYNFKLLINGKEHFPYLIAISDIINNSSS
jgi:hypothetical protein